MSKMSKKSQKNDRENILLNAEYDSVYRYALALCRNEQQAEDVTQETFLRALKKLDSFDGRSGLYTWLCAIAKNIIVDRARKKKHEVSLDDQQLPADDSVSVEQRAADRDSAMCIHRILHTLNDPYKEVFSLRVFGQLSFKDIADIFGKTESWARVTYHRAKVEIVDKMGKEGYI